MPTIGAKQLRLDHPGLVLAVLVPAVLVPHLLELGYWPSDPEVLTLGAGPAGLALLGARILARFDRFASLLMAIGVYWLADVYFDHFGYASAFVFILALVLMFSRHRDDTRRFLVVFSCVWIAINCFRPPAELLVRSDQMPVRQGAGRELPPLLHIILDEQMSPATLPQSIPTGSKAGTMLEDYVRLGFSVHSHAASSSTWTRLSLGQLVSFRLDSKWASLTLKELEAIQAKPDPEQDLFSPVNVRTAMVARNEYFKLLHRMGYSITTIQSSFLQFCNGDLLPGDECFTYEPTEHGHVQSMAPGRYLDKVALAATSLLIDYQRYRRVARSVTLVSLLARGPKEPAVPPLLTMPATMLTVLSEIDAHLRKLEPGRAYFAHLLLPHTPYMLNERCDLNAPHEWVALDAFGPEWGGREPYNAYWQQSVCVHARTMAMLNALFGSELGKSSIVVVHGDHGSKIWFPQAGTEYREDLPEMRETFLAIRMPGREPKILTQPVNLQREFKQFAGRLEELIER